MNQHELVFGSVGKFAELIGKKGELENAINKLNLNLDEKTLLVVLNIFDILMANDGINAPIKGIIEKIKEILSDGKIDLNDVPNLVKIVTDILNLNKSEFKQIKFGVKEIGVVIKIIISILIQLEIISSDEEVIMKMVDSSLSLLETTINVGKLKCNLFSCCN